MCTGPDGRETLLAVVDGEADRTALEAALHSQLPGSAPALELIDRAAFEAIERLVQMGVLRFTSEDRCRLHRSTVLPPEKDAERERRLTEARDLLGRSERKIKMATVLAGGGFPVEALPSLREGVELGLQARAVMEGLNPPDSETIPDAWIEGRLPAHLLLIRTLRGGSETLLGATATEVGTWITEGETLVRQIGDGLRRM
jgi:hypothetical protein